MAQVHDCLFCRIVAGDVPAEKVYSNDLVTVFKDISPVAPVHLLIIPNRHIAGVAQSGDDDSSVMGEMLRVARIVAEDAEIDATGYRLVINAGDDGGQTVSHLHLHVIGGRKLSWPPG